MSLALGASMMGASAIGGMFSSRQAGRAAQRAAESQREAAERAINYGQGLEKRVEDLAKMSPQELQAYERSLSATSNLVERDSKLLEAIDPALMEASQQALQLLRGQDAAALSPLRTQRQSQRQQLVKMLREQLGPGAETSTAGQKALQQFDMETSSLMSGVQQQTLGGFLGLMQNQRGQTAQNAGALANVGGMFGQASGRVAGLVGQVGQATLGAMSGVGVNTAGASHVGALTQAQGMSSMFNQMGQIGGLMAGRGFDWGFGGSGGGGVSQVSGNGFANQMLPVE